jgi:hypothetical protein
LGKLEAIDEKLTVMERNNWERFAHLMDAIDYSYSEITTKLTRMEDTLNKRFENLRSFIESYLRYIVDQGANSILININKAKTVDKLLEEFEENTTSLRLWLNDVAAITARTGYLELSHNKLPISQSEHIQKLSNFIAPERAKERAKLDYPLGLFVSLAQVIHPPIFNNITALKLINPQDWHIVLSAYCHYMNVGQEYILEAPQYIQNVYLSELDLFSHIVNSTLSIIDTIANTEQLWSNLVTNYQKHFGDIKKLIDDKTQAINEPLSAVNLQLTLSETAEQNFIRLENQSSHKALAGQLTVKASWVGLKGTRNEDLTYKVYDTGHRDFGVPPEELNLVFDQVKYDALISQPTIKNKFDNIRENIRFALGFTYNLTTPSFLYYCRDIDDASDSNDFSVYMVPSIKIQEYGDYPFAQGNLFRHDYFNQPGSLTRIHAIMYGYTHFGSVDAYTKIDSHYDHSPNWKSFFYERSEFDNHVSHISELLEKDVLVPARKAIVDNYTSAEALEKLLTDFEQDYLQLVAFIQLLDPSFMPKEAPAAINRLRAQIQKLIKSGSAEDLAALSESVQSAAWQEELHYYMGTNGVDFTSLEIRKKLLAKLNAHLVYQQMMEDEKQINATRKVLDITENRAHFSKKLNEVKQTIIAQKKLLEQAIATQAVGISFINQFENNEPIHHLQEITDELFIQADDIETYVSDLIDFENHVSSEENLERK